MRHIDLSDGRRTAESVLAVSREHIPDVIADLLRARRFSAAVHKLNGLARNSADRDLGKRALRHLGFPDA